MNWYAYANGNPLMFIDPSGLSAWNRFMGGLQAVGGGLEVAAGVSIGVATSWSGVGIVGGGAIAVHGADTFQSGFRQLWSGEQTDTFTSQAIQSSGVSQGTANMIDAGLGFASGGASLVNGTVKTLKIVNSAEAAGMSTTRALNLWESGSVALNQADFIALGGRSTSALNKGLALENGFQRTTSFFESTAQSVKLFGTGLTPYGDFAAGIGIGASAFSTAHDSTSIK
jgi:hypothetical protein